MGEWRDWLDASLRPRPSPDLYCLELFAGGGGLSLGLCAAGFRVLGVDADGDCASTHALNAPGGGFATARLSPTSDWSGFGDASRPDLLAGGPPCQPFSRRGKRMGADDPRDGVPAFLAAVEALSPRAVLMENVPGIGAAQGGAYVAAVRGRLEAMGHSVFVRTLDAAEHLVPQRRKRTFLVAFLDASDAAGWEWPPPSGRAVTVAEAVPTCCAPVPGARTLTTSMDEYVARYERASGCARPRDILPDRPARTVTCRNLASATSDMLRFAMPDGSRRTLLPSEGAALQGFPSWYRFAGRPASVAAQIGNAVPPPLALALGLAIRSALQKRRGVTQKNRQGIEEHARV